MSRRATDKTWVYVATSILAVGLLLRFLGLWRGYWLDEFVTLNTLGETLAQTWNRLRSDTHHPLYFLLLNLWSRPDHGPQAVGYLRTLSLLIDMCALASLMAWLRPLGRRGSLAAGLFYATAPMILRYSVELRPYALLLLTTILSFWATTRLVFNPRGRWVYLGVGVSWTAMVATHPIGAMVVAALALWPCWHFRRNPASLRWVQAGLAGLLPAATLIYFHFVWALPHPAESIAWMPAMSWQLVLGTVRYLFIDASYGVPHPSIALQEIAWGLFGIFFAAQARRHHLAYAAITAVLLLLVIGYSIGIEPIFWYRSLLPAVVGLVAYVTLQLDDMRPLARATWLALCLTQAAAWCYHAASPVEPPVAGVLRKEWHAGDEVLYYPDFLRLYVRGEAPWTDPAACAGLTADAKMPSRDLQRHKVFVVMRSDLPLARDPSAVLAGLRHWQTTLTQATDVDLLLVPGHDLEIMDQTAVMEQVLTLFTGSLGQPVKLPVVAGLLRWRWGRDRR